MNTAVTERKSSPAADLKYQLEQQHDSFNAALPKHIPVERFMRVVMTATQQNPALLNAERKSLFMASLKAAQDGLLPDGREAALVIYGKVVQYMPMIAGVRKKVRNSGEIATWDAQVVYANDAFEYELGDDPFIKHKPNLGDRGPVIAAYSVALLKTGEKSREVMSVGEIEAVRKRSRASGNGPWVTDYAEMCRKTVARRHSKVLPMSTDLDDLIRRDDDLYDLKSSSDAQIAPPPRTLSDRMDALAAPKQDNPIESAAVSHDPDTGEIASDDQDNAEGDDDATAETGETTRSPQSSEMKAERSTASPTSEDDPSSRTWGTEESVKAAYERGVSAKQKGMARRALPTEFREEEARAEADAWENGWDDETGKSKAGKP